MVAESSKGESPRWGPARRISPTASDEWTVMGEEKGRLGGEERFSQAIKVCFLVTGGSHFFLRVFLMKNLKRVKLTKQPYFMVRFCKADIYTFLIL